VLVRRYQDRAYNVAFQVLRHHEDALDVAQEAFARAYMSIGRFRGGAAFYTWLYRILVNVAIDHVRARAKGRVVSRFQPDASQPGVDAPDPGADPAARLEAREIGAQIVEAVGFLPVYQRTALMLREIDGLSYREIARVMNCSIGTVMSRLHAARQKLRRMLNQAEEPR
jgi:RNA polymerase sigma-70 factor (ECF subfamily)